MPSVPEELNVFRRPHGHMMKLVNDIERELSATDFGDAQSYLQLLGHLSTNFHVFQCHEEIENRYIVGELVPRLPCHRQAKLENDLHSDNRLSTLVKLVGEGLQMEYGSGEERVGFGERLKTAIASFTLDFLPHMREEEEVFLPLLVQYFTEPELKKLTRDVIELHHLNDSEDLPTSSSSSSSFSQIAHQAAAVQRPSLPHLPPEVLLTILHHLGPRDLLRVSQTHSSLHRVSFDPSLWTHLHPVRWACGYWDFFSPPAFTLMSLAGEGEGEEEGVMAIHDAVIENDAVKELMSVEGKVNANLRGKNMTSRFLVGDEGGLYMEREAQVLTGLVEHVLPRVGSHTLSLDLAHGKAVSNAIVFRMLRLCPNLSYLDLSYTGISDFAFQGLLSGGHNHWRLSHVDLTGCGLITDTSLQRLAQAISLSLPPTNSTFRKCCGGGCRKEIRGGEEGGGGGREGGGVGVGEGGGCEMPEKGVGGGGGGGGGEGGGEKKETMLQSLILSGCHQITDVGLRTLAVGGGLPRLRYLNLSGLPNISQRGLSDLVTSCPSLHPELLFYCDNLGDGPYADCASGCQNVGLSRLACCRANC